MFKKNCRNFPVDVCVGSLFSDNHDMNRAFLRKKTMEDCTGHLRV